MKLNSTEIKTKYSLKNEIEIVRSIFKDKDFIIENGYDKVIFLPKNISLRREPDFNIIKKIIIKEFNSNQAEKSEEILLKEISKNKDLLSQFIKSFRYKMEKEVVVLFTRYDTQGSYHLPNEIVMNMNYKTEFLETFIHELIHLLIQEPVVNKKHVEHSLKEGLVDHIIITNKFLHQVFPDYKYQSISKKSTKELIQLIN